MPEHLLEQHLAVCPKAGQLNKTEALPYYKAGINFQQLKVANGEESKEEQKEEKKLDQESTKLFLEVIEKTYAKLKVKYGACEEFRDLFTVDEQVDQIEKVVGDLSETMKHGNQQNNIVKHMIDSSLI